MINLPATVEEAQAIETARAFFGQIDGSRIEMMFGAYDFADSGDGKRFARDAMKWLALRKPEFLMQIVENARNGWALADEALRELILDHQNRGEPMPTYLAAYAMDVVAGLKPRGAPAQRRESHFLRDIRIATVVLLVVEQFNIRPTRNPASHRRLSACAIVAQVLNMSEPAVVKIWQRISSSL